MRIDARYLRREIGTHAHRLARQLVDQFEGAQIEVVPGSSEQGIEVLKKRRNDQLVPIAAITIEQGTAKIFDPARFGG